MTDTTEADDLAAECDAFVAAECENFREFLKDPRRKDGFERATRVLFYLERALPNAASPNDVRQIGYTIQMNNEQRLRIVGVDLRNPVDASKLATAADILAYIDLCQTELQAAERVLKESDPDEFRKLKDEQGKRYLTGP